MLRRLRPARLSKGRVTQKHTLSNGRLPQRVGGLVSHPLRKRLNCPTDVIPNKNEILAK